MKAGIETLWAAYLRSEHDRIRAELTAALDRFIDRLLEEPAPSWHAWARELAATVADRGAATPVRFPLFRRVLLPALADGVRRGEPGCARWLASFEPHELPTGVLYGLDGATAEQCGELLDLLGEVERHVVVALQTVRFAELIRDCDHHFRSYREYLRTGPLPGGYEEYLEGAASAGRPQYRDDTAPGG